MQPGSEQLHWTPTGVCPASATMANGVAFVWLSLRSGENHIGIVNMQTAATNSFLLTSSSSLKRFGLQHVISLGGFYQQILILAKEAYKRDALSNLGNNVIALTEHAYTFRQMNTVEEMVKLSQALPLPDDYKRVAEFYKAVCAGRKGQIPEATFLFESVAENAPVQYRARALSSLGTLLLWNNADQESASQLFNEACYVAHKHAGDLFTVVNSQRMLAVMKSMEGDHEGALADLESLLPLVRAVALNHPQLYYDYLNNLAVELGEVGRLEEALSASRITLSSPFAGAYFEWRETQAELMIKSRRSSRSVVATGQINSPAQNVVSLPTPQQPLSDGFTKYEASIPQQARVLKFQDYMKMAKEVNDATESRASLQAPVQPKEMRLEDLRRMTTRQKLLRIMDLMSDDKITDDQLLNVLLILEDFFPEQRQGN
jgi:tetratricopeptide (TPR) repeat protein